MTETRALTIDDVPWMAGVMAERRALYEGFSPTFWRPSQNARDVHEPHLAACVTNDRFCGLRTEHGFLLAELQDADAPPWWSDVPIGFVDDFAVTAGDQWADDGSLLLHVAWTELQGRGAEAVRVVTARRDEPKVAMLENVGLRVGESWWVIRAAGDVAADATFGPVADEMVNAIVVPAPPVYAPGGPVLLTLAVEELAIVPELPSIAARSGAVLVIVATKPSTPELTGAVRAAGFDEVSQYYMGTPAP